MGVKALRYVRATSLGQKKNLYFHGLEVMTDYYYGNKMIEDKGAKELSKPTEEENDFAQECLDLKQECLNVAKSKHERVLCWGQFGLCVFTHSSKCFPKCMPQLDNCIKESRPDFIRVLACGADYISCLTECD